MNVKPRKKTLGMPSWAFSLMVSFGSLLVLFFLSSLFVSILNNNEKLGGIIAYLVYDTMITIACFIVCRNDPKSIWTSPVLCNVGGIIPAFIEPTFWTTFMWVVVSIGWITSLSAALAGMIIGKRSFGAASDR